MTLHPTTDAAGDGQSPLPEWLLAGAEAPQPLGANAPLLLASSATIWLVSSGRVYLFAVPLRQGRPAGVRRHLFTASAGSALFGLDAAPEGLGLLASGSPGTTVLRLDLWRLGALAVDSAARGDVARLIDGWVAGLVAALVQDRVAPEAALLAAGSAIPLAAGENVRAEKQVLWVSLTAGRIAFLGRRDVPLLPGLPPVPLVEPGWLLADDASTLDVFTTTDLLVDEDAWYALAAFHTLAAFHALARQLLTAQMAEIDRGEGERLATRVAADGADLRGALDQLAAILTTADVADPLARPAVDPLLAACQLVGAAQGLTIVAPPPSAAAQQTDPLARIARASRARHRRVALREGWWQQDNGPLLGYRADDSRPVALLPTSTHAYTLVDPTEQTRVPVTAAVAASLAPLGAALYRPFPEHSLSAWDLLRFGARDAGPDLATIVVMGTLGGLVAAAIPLATGVLFGQIIPGAAHGQLLQITLGLIAAALAGAGFQITRGFALLRLEGRLGAAIQAAIWDRLLSLPAPFFRQYTAGDLATRAMGVDTIRQLLTDVVISAVLGVVFSVYSYALLFVYSGSIALVATGLIAAALAATLLASYRQVPYQREIQRIQGDLSGTVLQFLTGIGKLRVAGAESRAYVRWVRGFSQQRRFTIQVRTVGNLLASFTSGFPVFASLVIFAFVLEYQSNTISGGAFLALNAAFGQVLAAVLQLGTVLGSLVQAVPIYERARPLFEALPEVDEANEDPGVLRGDVELAQVTFRYSADGPPVLENVSIRARPGEFIALVGPSGSGKSTVLRLLLGFERPEAGSVYYDGQDLATLDVRAVRQQLGVVLQTGQLMLGDVLTNILGSSTLTVDDAWEAARLVGLDADIQQMPMGMYTYVAEGGGTLSGGQRQRLMIARAMVAKPRLLLLDEATSALDNQTQGIVSHSLAHLQATRIVIAHRLSTIIGADRIYVLVGGRVVQSGTYEALMREPGPFADLAQRQLL
jgi:ATP-binding cassette subfamily C protein